VGSIETSKRSVLEGVSSESMFELSIELSSLVTMHERAQTSVLFLGGIVMSAGLFIHAILDIAFRIVVSTQGSRAVQTLLWSLYQTRKTKTITMASRKLQSHMQSRSHTLDTSVLGFVTQLQDSEGNLNNPRPQRSSEVKSKTIVDEILSRERYRYKVDSVCARVTRWCLNKREEHA